MTLAVVPTPGHSLEGTVMRCRFGASDAEKLRALGAMGRFCAAHQLQR